MDSRQEDRAGGEENEMGKQTPAYLGVCVELRYILPAPYLKREGGPPDM